MARINVPFLLSFFNDSTIRQKHMIDVVAQQKSPSGVCFQLFLHKPYSALSIAIYFTSTEPRSKHRLPAQCNLLEQSWQLSYSTNICIEAAANNNFDLLSNKCVIVFQKSHGDISVVICKPDLKEFFPQKFPYPR